MILNVNFQNKDLFLVRIYFYDFFRDNLRMSIQNLFVKMQDFHMGWTGRNILKSLGEITRQKIVCDNFSHFTEGSREKHQAKVQKYSRKQSCNASDLKKLLKNSSSTTHKGNCQKENLYYYDIPAVPKFKKQISFQHSRNHIQKANNYSQIQSCLDISEHNRTAASSKPKKATSIPSTCCSGKRANKSSKSSTKSNILEQMLMRSSLLLEGYESRCRQLQKENVEMRLKCEVLNKKIKRLNKTRQFDLIHVF